MPRSFIWILLAALALWIFLWFGLDRRPENMRKNIAADAGLIASTSANAILKEAYPQLDPTQEAEIHGLERMLEGAGGDVRKREVLEDLSGAWYRAGFPALAGHYAERIAELAPSDTTWGIAGTTYTICLRADSLSAKQKAFCQERAVASYENAISLAPEESRHKLNLALYYTENPPDDNPMRGILMLRELNEAEPDNIAVLIQLGRLALQTQQYDRAIGRLQRAISLDPNNPDAQCLLAQAASLAGDTELSQRAKSACETLLKETTLQ